MRKKMCIAVLAISLLLSSCARIPGIDSEGNDSYVMGTIMDDGWESEYWNLRYTAPEGVYMLSEEGLNTMMGLSNELLAESYSERQQKYRELTSLYEMMSMTLTGEAEVEVKVEKLLMKRMSTEDYKRAVLQQFGVVKNPVYEILDDSGTAEIGGEVFALVNVIATIDGDKRYTQDYYFRVAGDRALIIAITYTDDTVSIAEEILNGFDVY